MTTIRPRKVIHLIPNPVSGVRFVDPIVRELTAAGFDAELWVEPGMGTDSFIPLIGSTKRLLHFNLVLNPFANLKRLAGLWRRFRVTPPECVHAHQTRGALLPLLAARLSDVPIRIYHNHGSAYWGTAGLAKWLFGTLEKINCALATHVLFVNAEICDHFVRDHLVPAAKVTVLGQGSAAGIDLSDYPDVLSTESIQHSYRDHLGIHERQFVVLYVGRPFKRKGFDFLLNAWGHSPFSAAGDILLLVGCSERDVMGVLGAHRADGIRALGYREDVRSMYLASDVVVLPSHHEGFSYALLEAGACGRPIVASDVPGIRAYVRNDVEGLLHPVDDEDKFIASLLRLKSMPDLRKAMGRNARSRSAMFNRKDLLQLTVNYYQSLFSA